MRLSLQRSCLLLTVLLGIPGLLNGRAHSVVRAGAASTLYLDASRPFAARYVGSDTLVEAMRGGQAKALSITQADLNEDGVADLVAGYRSGNEGLVAVYRGSLDAMAPQSPESFQAIARGEFPSPFLPEARVFSVPAAPDFLGQGRFTPSHHIELILAARGGRAVYVLKRDDADHWSVAQAVEVPGEITALAAARILAGNEYAQVFIGVHGAGGPKLLVYSGSAAGLSLAKSWRLAGDATDIAVGNLDGDALPDAAVLAGTHVLVLHGRDLREAAGAARDSAASLEAVSVPFKVSAIALGAFVYDRDPRLQMALLSPDGAVHIVAHGGFDGRPLSAEELRAMSKRRFARDAARRDSLRPASAPAGGRPEVWKEIERFSAIVAMQPGGRTPLLFRTRISGFAADDVMALDRGRGTLAVIEHPNGAGNAAGQPGVVVRRKESLDSVVAAMPMRVNVDGRPGVVLLRESQVAPFVMMPLPDPTFVVNTTADTVTSNGCALGNLNTCSLREAIIEANAAAGTDTIMIPAGTYQLAIAPNLAADPNDASGGDLDITDGVNIVGADPATTIIQAGPSAGAGIDKIFSINPLGAGAGFDVSISNVTLRFGKNPYAAGTGDEFGGALDWSAGTDGTGNLTITNCVITNNATTDGDGGGIALSNPGGSGVVTITNSTIQNNAAQRAGGNSGVGGGILAGSFTSVVMTNSQVLSNQAPQVIGVAGQGGGMFLGPFSHTFLHHCTISGNQAAGDGGGIWTNQGLTIDQATTISGNTAGNNGGGLWNDCGDDFTFIDSVTFAGNSATAGGGGGIHVDVSAPQTLLIHFSRIANNGATTGSGLDNIAGLVDATDNWWGCNQGPTLAPCDQIALSGAATGSNSFDPWIVLSHTANPPTIGVGGSTTLTASFLQDSQGGSISAGNLTAFTGVPIVFNNPVQGTLSNQQLSIQPSGTATATFTANAAGAGHADAVVDSATVTANINILAIGPPTISKSFGAATIPSGGSTSLTFVVNNPDAFNSLTGIGFTDTLPNGLGVSTPNGLTGSCGGGTITAVAGSNSISLSGGTLAASSSCTFSVNVTGQGAGPQNNTTGPVSSTEGGTGAPSNTASVNVAFAGAVGIPTLGTVGVAIFLVFLAIGGMLMLGRARIV